MESKQQINWSGGNYTAHGTIALLTALLRHLDGNVTIFSDVRDKETGVAQMLDQIIKKEEENDAFNKQERINLIKAVGEFFK